MKTTDFQTLLGCGVFTYVLRNRHLCGVLVLAGTAALPMAARILGTVAAGRAPSAIATARHAAAVAAVAAQIAAAVSAAHRAVAVVAAAAAAEPISRGTAAKVPAAGGRRPGIRCPRIDELTTSVRRRTDTD